MKDLRLFATEAHPLHPSGMRVLLECSWRSVMDYWGEAGVSGPAADTGSAMHRAAELFHRGSEVAACLEGMREGLGAYPLADLVDAATMFLAYARDTRNQCELVAVEQSIAFSIAAAPEDETGAPVAVVGRVDQVRVAQDGSLRAWDIKTSKLDPLKVLHDSLHQLAAYCVGASYALRRRVEPGGTIHPRRYHTDPSTSPVFYHATWTLADCEHILEEVRHRVARVRAGHVFHFPTDSCRWCVARTPDVCFPKLLEVKRELRRVSAES